MKNSFIILLFLLFCTSSCAIKRCKGRQCTVKMVHYHNGDEFRGVSLFTYLFKNKNPRYGWGFPNLVKDPNGVQDPNKNGFDKKSKAYLKVIKPEPPKPEKAAEEAPKEAASKPTETSTDTAPASPSK